VAREPAAPARLSPSGAQGPEYVLRPDLFALHDAAAAAPGGEPVARLGAVRVYRGETPRGAGPVYGLPGGALSVPTGRAYVRLREGADARGLADAFRGAGFRIESVPGYAPHTAWLSPVEGGVGNALQVLDALRGIPGVEHAEAEMLQAKQTRE
jgi:hypothetical protein